MAGSSVSSVGTGAANGTDKSFFAKHPKTVIGVAAGVTGLAAGGVIGGLAGDRASNWKQQHGFENPTMQQYLPPQYGY